MAPHATRASQASIGLYLVIGMTLLLGIDGNIWSTLGILGGVAIAILAIHLGQDTDHTASPQ